MDIDNTYKEVTFDLIYFEKKSLILCEKMRNHYKTPVAIKLISKHLYASYNVS